MSHKTKKILSITLILFSFFVVTHIASAFSTNLIVCGTSANSVPPPPPGTSHPCDFNDLVTLAVNFVNFLITYSFLVAVISFSYAGFLYLTSQGNPGQISKAHGIFKTTAIGFLIVLSAWLIVYAITGSLLNPTFNPLINPGS